ncbi:MAG TPA: acyl-CoA desaturase [Urbifossiella sp.]|jgi:stearoyl-CoA desaturase (delta-9 desaturase)|nr:acyl-CoA desaturase [Urbifossiella sp.]
MLISPAAPAAAPGGPGLFRAARVGLALAPLVLVHLSLFALPVVPLTLPAVVIFVVLTRVSGLGVTVGFHRGMAHHAYRTSRVFRFLLAAAGCTALQKGPLWWVVHHRKHHAHSDVPGDVHSPVVDGLWYAHAGWLFVNDLNQAGYATVRDLARFPELVWLDRLWMLPGAAAAGLCYWVDGWSGLVWGFGLATVLVFQVTFAVNSIGHRWGRRRFATREGSRNNAVLGVLAMGDGWHNNHHRAPRSARHGLAWYELDVSYQTIRLFRALGLVWDVRQPPAAVLAAATGPAPAPDGPAVGRGPVPRPGVGTPG